MNRRLGIVVASLVGSLVIYCCQLVGDGGDGGVKGARAEGAGACCGAPVFTKIAEGKLSSTQAPTLYSGELDCSPYRQVVLYSSYSGDCATHNLTLSFLPSTSTTAYSASLTIVPGAPVPVVGPRGFLSVSGECKEYSFLLLGLN